jgi:undecaprenyl-diphosphatase
MTNWLDKIDKELFLYFNSFHTETSDQIWIWITNIPTWIPLYCLLVFFIIKVFKQNSWFVLAAILLVILASDQFTSSFMKPFFGRLRPCYDQEIGKLVHVADKCGGQYGFASGHAANSFGIAVFIFLLFKRYWHGTALIFLWAAVVAFSRIMVGVHYPGDILIGGLVGSFFGWLCFNLLSRIYYSIKHKPLIKS